ncbi:MAG: hypothetical protein CMM58_12070 [Rhodospirillaceae bacterium]|nr:hypothetical protein [Rhodospirillaceae bacterium]|tara:strand:+ start:2169 stop:3293 length:1125 start_codon:yes stop_codon:yes gene_type:complete
MSLSSNFGLFLNDTFERFLSDDEQLSSRKNLDRQAAFNSSRRMNLNESSYPPSPYVIEMMKSACAEVHRYPDPNWTEVTSRLSAYTGMPQDRIVMASGSDEFIVAAGRITLSPSTEVVAPAPSFPSYYKAARTNGAKLISVPVRPDGANDVDNMLSKMTNATRLVFAATPNNPTGAMMSAEDVERLAKSVPDNSLLILDEAYYEFAVQAGSAEHLEAMRCRRGPWAVFRTFSKAFGLAGIRVGYALCGSEQVYRAFQAVRSVFNVNLVAQVAAEAALKDLGYMRNIVRKTLAEGFRLREGLIDLGCKPYPSAANFVTASTPLLADIVVDKLAQEGILISGINTAGFEKYIRVTIGTRNDTDAFLKALSRVIVEK